MNKYLKKIKSKNKYREFIKVLNGLLQLSDREVEILSLLLQLDTEWPVGFTDKNVLSTDSRKYIMSATRVNKNNLVKYLNKFKSYGIIEANSNGWWQVKDTFKPIVIDNEIKLTFILDINDN